MTFAGGCKLHDAIGDPFNPNPEHVNRAQLVSVSNRVSFNFFGGSLGK
jgi:hypothetical protein